MGAGGHCRPPWVLSATSPPPESQDERSTPKRETTAAHRPRPFHTGKGTRTRRYGRCPLMASLTVGVCREITPGDRRVAPPPESVPRARTLGLDVLVETGAGERLRLPDPEYRAAGAGIGSRDEVIADSDVVVALRPPACAAGRVLRRGQVMVALLTVLRAPLSTPFLIHKWADEGLTVIALDLVGDAEAAGSPLDAAASMEQLAGYKAALLAADLLDRPLSAGGCAALPGTAARALIVGHGPAARQAGRTLEACGTDVLTADDAPSDLRDRDIVVTSLRPWLYDRPRIVLTAESLATMRPGSVVVDMVADQDGGNVEGSEPGTVVRTASGVLVAGAGRLAERLPRVASDAYASHVIALLQRIASGGVIDIDPTDPVLSAVLVTHRGLVLRDSVWRPIMEQMTVAGLP
ncbi:Rossmann-fold NAD(P)-binding domain-containing protein [Streptomyces salinarius]|uniref:hypothetical protein n=1 Tax=Streptomyces salinarius TaxID=2762598 RepID=UPI0028F6DDC5|nr:hypothetical protein [Streptomyces salinarius]